MLVGVDVGVLVAVAVEVGVAEAEPVAVAVGVGDGPPQVCIGDVELRGAGVAVEKSAALLSVSVQPEPARMSDNVFEPTGATAPSKQLAVPYPIKSIISAPLGHAPVRAVVPFTKAILPFTAPMLIVPIASGVGKGIPTAPPDASWIRKYLPAGIDVPLGIVVTCHVVPVGAAY